MTITKFDARTAKLVEQRIEAPVAASWPPAAFSKSRPQLLVQARHAFKMLASLYGFAPSDYGREFDHPSYGRCSIVGLMKEPAQQMPILFKRHSDDTVFRTEAAAIKRLLEKVA